MQCKAQKIKLIRICEDPNRGTENADHVIVRHDLYTDDSLCVAIKELLLILNQKMDVDVARDTVQISEQYRKYYLEHSLANKYPEIVQYWGDKNGTIKPTMVSAGSNRKFWFRCIECSQEYQSSINNRIRNQGFCEKCSDKIASIKRRKSQDDFENELHMVHPRIKLLSPYINAKTPIKCECLDCGYGKNGEWSSKPMNLLNDRNKQGNGCPQCSGRMRSDLTTFVEKLKVRHPNIVVLSEEYLNNKTPISCMCNICGNGKDGTWNPTPNSLLRSNGLGCPLCSRKTASQERGRLLLCKETGEVFRSIAEASRKKNIPRTSINGCLSGRLRQAGGYTWQYYQNPK